MDEAARIRAPPTEGEEQQHLRTVVLCNMGACHWIMNGLDDADAVFRKVLEADPENVTARKSLAKVWNCPIVSSSLKYCSNKDSMCPILIYA